MLVNLDGKNYYLVYEKSDIQDWIFLGLVQEDIVNASMNRLQFSTILLVGAVVLCVAAFFISLIIQKNRRNLKKKDTEISEAIQKGEVVFIDNFGTVKVCTDINTLTSFSVDKGQEYSKNRVMRVLNQFCNDVYRQFSLYYIGKVDNNESGRGLLKGWIVGYLNEMQANGGIQNFVADDVTVQAGNSVDSVLVGVWLQPVDAIEKIYMDVAVSVNAEAV